MQTKGQHEPRPDTYAAALRRHLGAGVFSAFEDPDVNEVYLNAGDRHLWVDTRSRGRVRTDFVLGPVEALAFLNTVASLIGQPLTSATPVLQARLPREGFAGARLQGFVPPVVDGPCFVVRKPPAAVFRLEDWYEQGILSLAHCDLLREHVAARSSILVAGATRSGKTTFVNSLLQAVSELCPADRILLLEDTQELVCPAPDHLSLRTEAGLTLADLVKTTLRSSPDRIVVGEVRDGSALDLLDSWATGHPGGLATVHATDAAGALERLDRLAMRNRVPSQRPLIAEAVQIVLVLAGGSQGRTVRELVAVEGLDPSGSFRFRSL